MARTSVATQPMAFGGLTPNLTAPTIDGDVVDVGRCFLHVENGGGAPITVTVQTPGSIDGLALEDRSVQVAAGSFKQIPLTLAVYRQPVGSADAGRAYVDYSAVASVTRAVISL